MSVKKPRVLPRYKSPVVTAEADASPEPRRRAKKKRRPLEIPGWLAIIPAALFACGGVILLGIGGLRLWLMVYYNLTAGEIVRTHPDRRLWEQVTLSPENFIQVLWAVVIGAAALYVCWSWLFSESRRAFKLSLATIGFFVVSPWLIRVAGGAAASRPSGSAAPAVARPQGAASPSVLTIFLDRMDEPERARAEQAVRKEFAALSGYVPDSARIEGNILMWKSTVSFVDRDRNKGEAIAILRRNNIRLSEFSEQWLKSDIGRRAIPGGAGPAGSK